MRYLLLLIFTFFSVSLSFSDSHDYRNLMRRFVMDISIHAKRIDPNFIIIPQNGHELMHENGDTRNAPALQYIRAIDGAGQEDLFYGYRVDNRQTPIKERNYLMTFLDTAKEYGITILVTDYCSNPKKMDDSFLNNKGKGYISFAAPERELSVIPSYPQSIWNKNNNDITALSDAKNFLYLINPGRWSNKGIYLTSLLNTDYDIFILDAFFEEKGGTTTMLAPADIRLLKRKKNGGKRLVLCYMSIGEAEDYRYYWKQIWNTSPPSWLSEENPKWRGNYKVRYWEPEWQAIIFGDRDAYLDRIIRAGFDGVYLDLIEAFEYFE